MHLFVIFALAIKTETNQLVFEETHVLAYIKDWEGDGVAACDAEQWREVVAWRRAATPGMAAAAARAGADALGVGEEDARPAPRWELSAPFLLRSDPLFCSLVPPLLFFLHKNILAVFCSSPCSPRVYFSRFLFSLDVEFWCLCAPILQI